MALPLYNYFTGASSGTTVSTSNSGGTGNTAFNAVSIGTGATTAFSNTHTIDSTGSLQLALGSTNTTSYVEWSSTAIGTLTAKTFFRFYTYWTAYPSQDFQMLRFLNASAAVCAGFWMNTSGILTVSNAAGASVGINSVTSLNLNAWTRIEGWVIPSTTVGQCSYGIYLTPESQTPTETQTSAATEVLAANIGQTNFGMATAAGANFGPWWMANIALASAAIGPVAQLSIPTAVPSMQDAFNGKIASIGQAIVTPSVW